MNAALRRHHGVEVLALGIVSAAMLVAFFPLADNYRWLVNPVWGISSVVLGIGATVFGARQISGMNLARIDPTGKRSAKVGMALGAVTALGWIVLIAVAGYLTSRYLANATFTVTPSQGTHRAITTFHAGRVETTHEEILGVDGEWKMDGRFIRYSQDPSHTKLEDGKYRDGKREGVWTFWLEDGSLDTGRSGYYRDGVKVVFAPIWNWIAR
jgi:hypothetical protein